MKAKNKIQFEHLQNKKKIEREIRIATNKDRIWDSYQNPTFNKINIY